MNPLVWFLSEAAVPVAIVAAVGVAGDMAFHPVQVRHYRMRNRRWMRTQVRAIELRSRVACGSEEDGPEIPQQGPVRAGVELPRCAAPPAPQTLVGASWPEPVAPTSPHPRTGGVQ